MQVSNRKKNFDQSYDTLVTEITQFEHSFNSSKSLLRGKTFLETSPYLDVQPCARHSLRRPKLRTDSPQDIVLMHRLPLLAPSHLGPGTYKAETLRSPLVPSFEKAPRFPATFQERIASYRPHIRQLSSGEKKEVAQRIQTNIAAVKRYTPDERLKTLHEKAEMEEMRISLNRSFRTELAGIIRQKREENLKNKIRRFEWRMNPTVVVKGKKRWIGVLCGLSAIRTWQNRFFHRKILHIRSEKVLKFLVLICISIGRIRIILQRNRKNRAFSTLRKLVPFIAQWRIKHRQKLAERITATIEVCISQQIIYKLIVLWKRRVTHT